MKAQITIEFVILLSISSVLFLVLLSSLSDALSTYSSLKYKYSSLKTFNELKYLSDVMNDNSIIELELYFPPDFNYTNHTLYGGGVAVPVSSDFVFNNVSSNKTKYTVFSQGGVIVVS